MTPRSISSSASLLLIGLAVALAAAVVPSCTTDDTSDAEDVIPFESIVAKASPSASPGPRCADYFAPACGGPCPDAAQQVCRPTGSTPACGCAPICTSESVPVSNGVCPAGFTYVETVWWSPGDIRTFPHCMRALGSGCPTPGHTCKIVPWGYTMTRIDGTLANVSDWTAACAP